MSNYNFIESLNRIDNIIQSPRTSEPLDAIPVMDDLEIAKEYNINVTMTCVKVEPYNPFWLNDTDGVDPKLLHGFISEAIAIGRANPRCRDVMVTDNNLLFVYSTPYKEDLNTALDDAARIRTLGLIVAKKGEESLNKKIVVNIGMHYAPAIMFLGEKIDGKYCQFVWRGDIIEYVNKAADESKGNILISRIIWQNLSEKNQNLFSEESGITGRYTGNIINVIMNNWLSKG